MKSRAVLITSAAALLALSVAGGVFAHVRLRRLVMRQEEVAGWLELARSVEEATRPEVAGDAAALRLALELPLQRVGAVDAPKRAEEAASALESALASDDVAAAQRGAMELADALVSESRRVLRRSGERTAALGEDLLQIALIGGPILAALATGFLVATVHRPLRRAGRAATAVDAADAVAGLSGELAALLRGIDADRRARVVDLLRAGHLAALGAFAAQVAHDVRNPLTAVAGTAEAARRRLEASGEAQGAVSAADLRRIEEEAHRAGRLLGDLLDLAPRDPGPPERFDFVGELREAGRVATARAGVDPAAVAIRGADALIVTGHPSRWRRVFFNLIANAIDATRAAGGDAAAGSVEVRVTDGEGEAVVEVRDRGVGFAPEVARRLFEPFFTTKGAGGAGLGLVICEGLVREEGGSLRAHSDGPGAGACFRVTVPRGNT